MKKVEVSPTETIFPAPVVVVGTYDPDKDFYNIATFIRFSQVNEEPPVVSLGIKKKRLTYEILKKTGEFTVNFPSSDNLAKADFAGLFSGRRVNKFGVLGITPVSGEKVSAPIIEEFPVNLECKFLSEVEFQDHNVVFGEVVKAWVSEDVLSGVGGVDFEKMKGVIGNYAEYSYYEIGRMLNRWGFSNKIYSMRSGQSRSDV